MIKIDLPNKPQKLTSELQIKLTTIFKNNTDVQVWHRKFIKDAVFSFSNNKCIFSEIKLGEEGKYPEVEHYYPKSIYPEKVVEWGNLLPISTFCNKRKGNVDPCIVPLVNPLIDDPKCFFYILEGRLWVKNGSQKAINTINILGLNDRDHLRVVRVRIEDKIKTTLEDIWAFHCNDSTRCIRRMKELMQEGGRKEEYSATVSTYILQHKLYKDLKSHLSLLGVWNSEMDELEKELEFCSLPK